MLVLSASDQQSILTMNEAIDAVSLALQEYSAHRALSPIRTFLPVRKGNGTSIFMPSAVEATDSLGIKFVSVFPDNKAQGKKTIYGIVIIADVMTGEPLAMLEASNLTVLRTGAASGLATKYLAREDAKTLAVIGTGAQARGAVQAVMAVRGIEQIRLYNRNAAKAHAFAAELQELSTEAVEIIVAERPDDAVLGADVVVTATNSLTPVFSEGMIGAGVHVNAIGSFRPTMQELPTDVIVRADKVVVESVEGALDETGDLLIPIEQGLFSPEQIFAEIGEIAAGAKPGRERADERTVFKSVGLAAMDVVVAKAMVDRAKALGVGQTVVL
ncbi:MAG: ornithine cyclodeaminase family protein [Clostridia bacterium]